LSLEGIHAFLTRRVTSTAQQEPRRSLVIIVIFKANWALEVGRHCPSERPAAKPTVTLIVTRDRESRRATRSRDHRASPTTSTDNFIENGYICAKGSALS
jgi:hypothetical protein